LSSAPMPSRRRVVASAAAHLLVAARLSAYSALILPSLMQQPRGERAYIRERVTLQSPDLLDDVALAASNNGAALYVTARPSRPDSVPAAILDCSRGRPPPVLSARYANPAFPFNFELTSLDFTPEGAATATMTAMINGGRDSIWWAGEDLVISARLNMDGVALSRDPMDLVGRGIFCPPPGGAHFD
jgi:hypothetical protein